MLWAFAAAGATGILLGLWFRVAALAATSGIAAVACVAAVVYTEMALLPALLLIFGFVAVLQAGYLAGVFLSYGWSRLVLSSAGADVLGDGKRSDGGHRR